MSQVPLIVPLIVVGISIGGMWYKRDLVGVWKRVLLTATASGILNMGHALLLGYLKIPGTNTSSNTNGVFLATSALSGFLIVVTVFLSAIGMVKYKRGKELEPEE